MVAGEGVQQLARELLTECLPQPDGGRRLLGLERVHASAMLEDERHWSVLRLGGVHVPSIDPRAGAENPSRE